MSEWFIRLTAGQGYGFTKRMGRGVTGVGAKGSAAARQAGLESGLAAVAGRGAAFLFGQRRRFATVAAGVLAVGFGYHVVFGHNGLTAFRQKRHDERTLAMQLQQLTDENESLKGHVERLTTDPGAIEHEAREEFHYTRPGEVIVTLPVEAGPRRIEPLR